jgi:hypothetical protein
MWIVSTASGVRLPNSYLTDAKRPMFQTLGYVLCASDQCACASFRVQATGDFVSNVAATSSVAQWH